MFDDASVDFLYQNLRVWHTLGYFPHHVLVALTVHVGHIIAQSDIASLHHGIKFGKLADDFLVKVEDTSVVLPELLYILKRHETATDKIFHCALGNPLRVSDISFVFGQLFDEIRVDELQVKMGRKNAPNGNSVDARTLHGHFLHMMGEQQIRQVQHRSAIGRQV